MLRIIISAIKWSAAIILATVLLLSAIFILVQTRYGRDNLIRSADYILKKKYGIEIRAEGITGNLPYDMKIDHLALLDISGQWLDVRNITFQLSPLHLLKGHILINQFTADSITLSRIPVLKKREKPSRPFSLPSAIYHVGIKSLNVARLSLGKEILGKQADFIINAGVTEKEPGFKSRVFADIKRTDGIAGSAFLDAELKGAEPYLTVHAGIDEPETGLIGALLRIKRPLSMSFNGSGLVKNWSGALSAGADRLMSVDAQVSMHALEDLNLDISGTAELGPDFVRDPWNELLEKEVGFSVRARVKDNKNLFIDRAVVKSGDGILELNASLDTRQMTSEGAFKFSLKDLSPFCHLIRSPCSGELSIEGSFKGPITSPSAEITLNAEDFKTEMIRSDEFTANALIEFIAAGDSSGRTLHVSGSGELRGLYLPRVMDDLLEKRLALNLDMEFPYKGDMLINNLEIECSLLSARVSGLFNKKQNRGDFKAFLKTDSLDRYSGLLKKNIPMGIGTSLSLDGRLSGQSLEAHAGGKLALTEDADAYLRDILGLEAVYSGDIALSGNDVLTFADVKISSDRAGLAGSGQYDLKTKELHGLFGIDVKELAAFSGLVKRDFFGSAGISGSLDGTPDLMNMKCEFRADDIMLGTKNIQDVSGSAALSGKPLKNSGWISLSLAVDGYGLKGDSEFMLDNKVLSFKDIDLNGRGIKLHGNLSTGMENSPVQGEMKGAFEDLSIIDAFFGLEIQGSGDLDVKSGFVDNKNLIVANLHGKDISGAFGKTEDISLGLRLSGELKDPEISARASIQGYTNKNVLVKSVDISTRGKPGDMNFTLKGSGHAGYGVIVEASGSISLSSLRQSLSVNMLRGEYGILPVNLTEPLRMTRAKGALEIESMEFYFAGGTINGHGIFSKDSTDFNMDFNNIPASLMQLPGITQLEGSATGNIVLSGTLKNPEAGTQFTLKNLSLRYPQEEDMPSFNIAARAQLRSKKLEAELNLESATGKTFDLKMDMPLNLSLYPFSFGIPEKEKLNGRVSAAIDISDLALLAGLYNQRFMGKLDMDFNIRGTIKSPEITGKAALENGSYKNDMTGIFIKDIRADISAELNRFILNNISGADGHGGKISGKGWVDFSPSRQFPYSLSLTLKNLLFLSTHTTAFTVSGKPTISGTLYSHTLAGKLSIDKGEYRIPERLPADITDLEVKEINVPGQDQTGEQKVASKKSVMNLDMSVKGEGQVYLTGRGLNSEWKGDIDVKGTIDKPVIVGRLSVLRGSYNFLGKRFELTDGRVDLDGRYPMSPQIECTGEAKTSQITAFINLKGDLKKPEITLTSDPSKPPDEILAYLLYNRDISQITPFQAIAIGSSLNSMMGKSRYDILGSTRKILGVDQLELKQSEESADGSTVSVGKYLSDEIYIEVEKGLGTESGKASFTWEVTPNITIDTELRENSSTGVGINWKWDY